MLGVVKKGGGQELMCHHLVPPAPNPNGSLTSHIRTLFE